MTRREAFTHAKANGWTEHLLPIIPPGAKLAVGTLIPEKAIGKVPGTRYANGTYGGLRDWELIKTSEIEIRRWQETDCSIGINCRTARPIDVDSDNEEIVGAIRRVLAMRLGDAPWRGRGGTPRGLALYRAEAAIGGKVILPWVEPDGTEARLEILGFGNQFVAWGKHVSGSDYAWHGGSPFETAVDALPLLAEADIPLILEAVTAALSGLGCQVGRTTRRGGQIRRGGVRRKLGDLTMVAQDKDQAGRALMAIPNTRPNDHTDTHDKVLPFIAAFMGAVAGERVYIDRWLVPWLEQWEGNDSAWIEARIASFADGTDVGADRLFACARTWDFREVPQGEFEPVPQLMDEPAEVIDLAAVRKQAEAIVKGPEEPVFPASTIVGNPYTDQQMALQFWAEVGSLALRRHASGQWMAWNGKRWDTNDLRALYLVRGWLGHTARQLPEDNKRENRAYRIESVDTAPRLLKALEYTATVAEWDNDTYLLNTPRGIVDLRTGQWRAATVSDHVRCITPVNPVNEPAEVYNKAVMEIFDGDLLRIQIWNDWMALNLLGVRLRDAALVLSGSGRNGKSLLEDVVVAMLGDHKQGGYAYKVAMPDAFDLRRSMRTPHAESLAVMDGVRAVLFSEMPEGFTPNEPLLKAAIAGEIVEASLKYHSVFSYRFLAGITFATNTALSFTSSIPALRMRFHMLELLQQFNDDRDFYNRVLADAPKVLWAAIARCTEILQGAETYWLRNSWRSMKMHFVQVESAAAERFELADPIAGMLRRLVEKRQGRRVASGDLRARVRAALQRISEDCDEELPGFEEALTLEDRAMEMKIARAMREEFGARSTLKQENGQSMRGYHGMDYIVNPRLPFA
jgi:hypothetical protein